MRYYIDTEFDERGGGTRATPTITLISIGVVAEDGREFYAESADFDPGACNDWVRDHVLPLLGPEEGRISVPEIRDGILALVAGDPAPEVWGYYSAYDWVAFSWLFGRMVDVPQPIPKYCLDLQQRFVALGRPPGVKPADPEGEHNALVDARWNMAFARAMDRYYTETVVSRVAAPRCV